MINWSELYQHKWIILGVIITIYYIVRIYKLIYVDSKLIDTSPFKTISDKFKGDLFKFKSRITEIGNISQNETEVEYVKFITDQLKAFEKIFVTFYDYRQYLNLVNTHKQIIYSLNLQEPDSEIKNNTLSMLKYLINYLNIRRETAIKKAVDVIDDIMNKISEDVVDLKNNKEKLRHLENYEDHYIKFVQAKLKIIEDSISAEIFNDLQIKINSVDEIQIVKYDMSKYKKANYIKTALNIGSIIVPGGFVATTITKHVANKVFNKVADKMLIEYVMNMYAKAIEEFSEKYSNNVNIVTDFYSNKLQCINENKCSGYFSNLADAFQSECKRIEVDLLIYIEEIEKYYYEKLKELNEETNLLGKFNVIEKKKLNNRIIKLTKYHNFMKAYKTAVISLDKEYLSFEIILANMNDNEIDKYVKA